jgi:hypothetical protein
MVSTLYRTRYYFPINQQAARPVFEIESSFSLQMVAPSYWAEIAESPTRVTLRFAMGGETWKDLFSPRGSQYMTLRRHDRGWPTTRAQSAIRSTSADVFPTQLSSRVTEQEWAEFVSEIKESLSFYPAPCRCCIFSFIWDSLLLSNYLRKGSNNVKAVVEKHRAAMKRRGVDLTFFDKTGYYFTTTSGLASAKASYGKHYVFGMHLDAAGPM